MKQLGLALKEQWGGKRKGAGRKPRGKRAGVPHRSRPILKRRFPVHVTAKVIEGILSLRDAICFGALQESFNKANARAGFKVVHYSVQTNHIHFIVEAEGTKELSSGMRGLMIRMARTINKVMNRKGRVFADRYHIEIVKTLRHAHNTLHYVLRNNEHHTGRRGIDPCATELAPVAAPQTWLLRQARTKAAAAAAAGKHAAIQ